MSSTLATRPVETGTRVAHLDNVRYWAMLLVVVGHALTSLDLPIAQGIRVWIYTFHIPLFLVVSGYAARHYDGDRRQVRRTVAYLLVPYLILETGLQLVMRHYEGRPEHLMLLSPQWLGWFLAALVVYRLTSPIWNSLRYPIATAVVISLVAGLIEIPNVLALPKVLGLLPFYVVGMQLRQEHFARLADVRLRIASAVAMLTALGIALAFAGRWTSDWLLWKQRYDEVPLDSGPIDGVLTRAALIVVGLVLSAAALSLTPRARMWTSALGERTFSCYALHGFVLLVLMGELDLPARAGSLGAGGLAIVVVLAALAATALMTRPAYRVFDVLFTPRIDWAFRR